jgi:hypothetical protein
MTYGVAEYPLHGHEAPNVITSVSDVDLDALAERLHFINPSLSTADYRARMRVGTTPPMPEFHMAGFATVWGNGFRFSWKQD